jgi:hypothetical protein
MYARVIRWEGAEAQAMRDSAARIAAEAEPPDGVPAKGFLMLTDPEGGTGLGITLFETEEDRQKGHEVLNAMNPPGDGMGRRVSVEMYEVPVQFRA